MRRAWILLSACVIVGASAYCFLNRVDVSPGQAPLLAGIPALASVLERGEYLARAADCIACHTAPGGKPFAGGVAFKLPFGTIYSSNITRDVETGIGTWSDDEFVRALHEGIRKDGQHLYPAFPFTSYTQISRSDALAIKAYLFSLASVRQSNHPLELGFPFNQRWTIGFWSAAFLKDARFAPNISMSPQWNRGAYLATALGHCAECHTPRNLAFALKNDDNLSGEALEGWWAPNITSDTHSGIGAWSHEQIASYLATGHAQERGSAGGPMGEVVANSLQYLAPEDVAALVEYLQAVPARPGKRSIDVSSQPTEALVSSTALSPARTQLIQRDGEKLFDSACASCHQRNGVGQQTPYASLVGSSSVNDARGDSVTRMILLGADMRIRGVDVFMPSFAAAYSDTEIAELSNYVIGRFGGKKGLVTADRVREQRDR